MSKFEIQNMTRADLNVVVGWAASEGWNPGKHDADCIWDIDPNGFFKGVLDGNTIGYASALVYDDLFAFCGFYIVAPEYRAQGYGIQITRARLDYVGQRNVGIDGVLNMTDKYERLGYRTAHLSHRFAFVPSSDIQAEHGVVPVSNVSFEALADYDYKHFFAKRERFLKCWISQPHSHALAVVDDGVLKGYGMIRQSEGGHRIGPLFADDAEVAEALFRSLCAQSIGITVAIDVPESNASGMRLAQRYNMSSEFACARMYIKGDPGLPVDNIYGITTFEAG